MAATVLVVDDDDGVRQVVGMLLEETGYRVEMARDGWEALAAVRRTEVAMILLDLDMPRLDGHGFLRQLSDGGVRPAPTVVIVTGRRGPTPPGAVATIVKPVDVDDLLATIARHLAARW